MKLFLEFNKTEAEEVFNLLKTFKVDESKKNTLTKGSSDSKQEDTEQVAEQVEKQEEPRVEATEESKQEDTEQVKPVIQEGVNLLVHIRAVLQEKRQKGKRTEVNELVKSYGVTSLPDIGTEHHAELLEKAKAL